MTKMISKIYNLISNTGWTILGLFFLLLIFYFRLIRERLPTDLQTNVTFFRLCIYFYLASFFLFLMVYSIVKLFITSTSNSKFSELIHFFSNIFYTSLIAFYDSIKEYFKDSDYICFGKVHQKSGMFLFKFINTPYKQIIFLIVLDILPKFLVLFAFVLDVFVFNKFYYLYKFSFFLLLPLILRFLQYTFDIFCTTNIEHFDTILAFYDSNNERLNAETLYTHYYFLPDFELENYKFGLAEEIMFRYAGVKYDESESIAVHASTLYYCFFPMAKFFTDLNFYKDKYTPYMQILLYFGYMVGWGYVVYFSC